MQMCDDEQQSSKHLVILFGYKKLKMLDVMKRK